MTPPVGTLSQVEQPAGAVLDENGIYTRCVTGSTPTECALFPENAVCTSVREEASMIPSTGVHGEAAVHAGPEESPLLVQRLAAR